MGTNIHNNKYKEKTKKDGGVRSVAEISFQNHTYFENTKIQLSLKE